MKPISLRVRGGILGELILKHKSNRFQIKRPEVRQVWGDFWKGAGNIWGDVGKMLERLAANQSKIYPSYRQTLSKSYPVDIALKRRFASGRSKGV